MMSRQAGSVSYFDRRSIIVDICNSSCRYVLSRDEALSG